VLLLLFTKKAHNLRARTCTETRDGGVQQNPVSILFPVAETEEERLSGMVLRMMGCIKCSKRLLLPVAQTDRQSFRNGGQDDGMHQMQ
jgi:hypothetical protein